MSSARIDVGSLPAGSWLVKNTPVKARLYLETTVPSYLRAWPSRDSIRASHQQITREWWESRRANFEVFISRLDK